MKLTIVAGARPNFMKIAPIIHAISAHNKSFEPKIYYKLVHTGQHYDKNMSESFFSQLRIPPPDINLDCGGGTQTESTTKIMLRFEDFIKKNPTDLVIVVGDVNSTMACSIVSRKLNIEVAHVEAGIRSHDLSMPEEINRIVTDSISNYFFTTSLLANDNLISNGVETKNIFFVGNTMIDTLLSNKNKFCKPEFWDLYDLKTNNYLIITLHRPANVDNPKILKSILNEIVINSNDMPVIFPMHPRTKQIYDKLNLKFKTLLIVNPMSYFEFNYLVMNSKAVITDSGGITEETTVLGIPCLTIRDNTERPETITIGTNELVGTKPENLKPYMQKLFSGNWKKGNIPKLWDGHTSKRIVKKLVSIYNLKN